MALSNRKLTKEDVERCGVGGGDKKFVIANVITEIIQYGPMGEHQVVDERFEYRKNFTFAELVNALMEGWVPTFRFDHLSETLYPDGRLKSYDSYFSTSFTVLRPGEIEAFSPDDDFNVSGTFSMYNFAPNESGINEIQISIRDGVDVIEVSLNEEE